MFFPTFSTGSSIRQMRDGPMNKLWHDRNKMLPKPTLEQRIQWHREHQKHCACREAPKGLLKPVKTIKQK
jgi:hypothetical protein